MPLANHRPVYQRVLALAALCLMLPAIGAQLLLLAAEPPSHS